MRARWIVLGVILAVAAAARLWYLTAGVPHAVEIDEPIVVNHALRILQTGDWNPHVFNYPTLVIYFDAVLDIVRFLWGALRGEWGSLVAFDMGAVYATGRFAAALIGIATVYLTYRLGLELGSRGVALFAAAQLAVLPMHVRESHFVLTDVPMTALTVLAMWLALRAGRRSTVGAYAWAGAACGLAAAAKYTGGVVFVAVAVTWVLHEWRSVDRRPKLGVAVAAAALAFLIAAPYTVLDLPSFLDGFASLFSQFAGPSRTSDPAWILYLKHLWINGGLELTLALVAIPIVLVRNVRAWGPVVAFGAAYFYELSSHSHVFGRYVLPLLPIICLLSSAAIFELLTLFSRVPQLARPAVQGALLAGVVLGMVYVQGAATVRWLESYRRPDTRAIAADWLKRSVPKGAKVAVENSGPAYLDAAGFRVVSEELLIEHDAAWYRGRADYLIISAADLDRYGDLLNAGPTVFQISPTPQRWGPPIRIVNVAGK
jgi:4-amino-4-deoxy-L-arabinose transferase-like glycosyltransferase